MWCVVEFDVDVVIGVVGEFGVIWVCEYDDGCVCVVCGFGWLYDVYVDVVVCVVVVGIDWCVDLCVFFDCVV